MRRASANISTTQQEEETARGGPRTVLFGYSYCRLLCFVFSVQTSRFCVITALIRCSTGWWVKRATRAPVASHKKSHRAPSCCAVALGDDAFNKQRQTK